LDRTKPIKFHALPKLGKGDFVNPKITAMTFGDGQVSCETRWVTETVIRNETNGSGGDGGVLPDSHCLGLQVARYALKSLLLPSEATFVVKEERFY
jgi:hypothetical protein